MNDKPDTVKGKRLEAAAMFREAVRLMEGGNELLRLATEQAEGCRACREGISLAMLHDCKARDKEAGR